MPRRRPVNFLGALRAAAVFCSGFLVAAAGSAATFERTIQIEPK